MPILGITNGFDSMPDPDLETRSYQIYTGVSTNAQYFPTPNPTLDAMNGLIGDFFDALTECKDGDRYKIAVKNQKRAALVDGLHLWAAYVLERAQGDPVIAQASNFRLRKQPSPRPPLQRPENFRVATGPNPLELLAKIKRVSGAMSYVFQYATDEMMAAGNWQGITSTSAKCTIPGLQSGAIYNCRVIAIGARKQQITSDVIRCRVA